MLAVGDTIQTLEEVVPWYSGYGCNPSVVAPAGSVGMVASVDVPYFRAVLDIDGTYWSAAFYARDKGKTWRNHAG